MWEPCEITLLYGASKGSVARLQKVQNALCHFVFKLNKMSHATPFQQKLHWLPISYCILFKNNLLILTARNLSQPPQPPTCHP